MRERKQSTVDALTIPSIALGTWSWGTGARGGDEIFGHHLGVKELEPVFEKAMAEGLNLWDTAAVYGMNTSETILGTFIRKNTNVILSTKFTPQIASNSENAVEELLDASLERLGVDTIDLYWIHNPANVEKWSPKLIPLLKSGKVKKVGVSNHNLAQITRVNQILSEEGYKISAVQNHYSLIYRTSEKAGILDYCRENDIIFFSYMVLEQGALTDKYSPNNPLPKGTRRGDEFTPKVLEKLQPLIQVMKEIGLKHINASVAQIAIAWAIAKGTVPIIGVTKAQHVEDAVKAIKIKLNQKEIEVLEQVAKATEVEIRGGWEQPMI